MKFGIFKCANCGADYEKRAPRQTTCSRKCSTALWYRLHKKEPPADNTGICQNCGEEYERARNGMGQKYCSPKCRRAYIKKSNHVFNGVCVGCGVTFGLETSGPAQKFCSEQCRTKYYRRQIVSQGIYKKDKGRVLAKCPGCEKTYETDRNYIGTGTPRFFCSDCKKKNSYIHIYNPHDCSAQAVATL